MKTLKKLNLWRKFWGKRFRIVKVEKGLREDEIIFHGHRIYIPKKKEEDENRRD